MKKNILAIAIATAFAAPIVSADAPTIYGKINVNAGFVSATNDQTLITANPAQDMKIGSTASRVGIKGSEDLGNGLKAIYKMEFSVDVAASGAGSLGGRNQYLGLAGGFGTVLMGRHDTPEKMSQATDVFNDGAADLGKTNMTAGITVNETRAGNVLAYVSPSFSGVKLIAATVAAGGTTGAVATSAAVTYGSTKKGLYLAAGMTDWSAATSADTTRISAQYKTGGLTANVILMDAADGVAGNLANEGSVTQVNLAYKIGKFTPKFKVSMTDSKDAATASTTNMALGLAYSLGKKTTAYIYTVDTDAKNAAATDASYIGLVHKF